MVLVPVEAWSAVHWCTGTLAVHRVPVEVVWTLHRAADALADCFVENFIFTAFCGRTLALANVSVQIETWVTRVHGIAAVTAAGLRVPEEVRWAVVGGLWFLADAATFSRVEVMRSRAFVRFTKAAAGGRVKVETTCTFLIDAEAAALGIAEPLVASWAGLRFADAVTAINVPHEVLRAFVDHAFKGTIADVPRVTRVGRLLGFADALATVLIPDDDVSGGVRGWTRWS